MAIRKVAVQCGQVRSCGGAVAREKWAGAEGEGDGGGGEGGREGGRVRVLHSTYQLTFKTVLGPKIGLNRIKAVQ